MLNELAKRIYENAKNKGFYDDNGATNIGERLCLIHGEVSEALEADRKNNYCNLIAFLHRMEALHASYNNVPDAYKEADFYTRFEKHVKNSFEDEMADIIIRVLDMCAFKGIDIEKHIELKMKYNSLRPVKHGKKY